MGKKTATKKPRTTFQLLASIVVEIKYLETDLRAIKDRIGKRSLDKSPPPKLGDFMDQAALAAYYLDEAARLVASAMHVED
jgi:hypothetical protein